ncbi:hypothetical protein CSB45_04285 [candidate division KSB3 bacterium]|uniref:ArnT-like N-terminal domain-containing protein n=1 Tax=candidate division KSB3 bacterium TaxID=2044937 RepID=A0A2G6E949_9BACT|nr:MAG: hypothetical protein CSB45_04285 [candidate division KSB3 bacterium]PIE30596.1 MAG: hypothetical protein CSA57_02870 [candidate division KSB3 bacterium]
MLGFAALYILSMGGHGYGGVGTTTYDVTRSMVLYGSVAIKEVPWGKVASDGSFYAQYGIGHSLYNLPFYLIGHFFATLSPALASQYDRLTMFTTLLGQPAISALSCALLFLFCLRLGCSCDASIVCSCLYGLGTQAWVYAQLDFSEPILTFFLVASAYWLLRSSETRTRQDPCCSEHGLGSASATTALVFAGLSAGIAMSVKIVALIVLPFLYLFIVLQASRTAVPMRTKLCAFSVPLGIAGFGPVGTYNLLRFGSLFETGYSDEFTCYYGDVLRQFAENLWSLEGSIILYSPVILLAIPGAAVFYRRFRQIALLLFSIIASFFLFYPFTTNELYYGPRYLTPTLPFFMLIVGVWLDRSFSARAPRKFRRAIIIFLLLLGIFQQLVGVLVNYHSYYWRIQYALPLADEDVRNSEEGRRLQATPNLPHLLGHLWLLRQGLYGIFQNDGLPVEGLMLTASSNSGDRNDWIPYYGLDLWWCHRKILSQFGLSFPLSILSGLGAVVFVSCYQIWKIRKTSCDRALFER